MKKTIKLPQSEKGKEILMKYMSDFTLISEDEQAISESLRINKYNKGKCLLRKGEHPSIKCYIILMCYVR